MKWIAIGIAAILVIAVYAALTGDDDDGTTAPRTLPESQAAQDTDEPCAFDKADHPSYDGADLSGYATYLAKDDVNNCRQTFVDRVQRFAADTCKHQPLVYPADTAEFLSYLRSACAAAGTPIR